MFTNCTSLISLPDLSKWKTDNLLMMQSLFYDCLSLSFLHDISNWNNYNEHDINTNPNYDVLYRLDNLNVIYTYSSLEGDKILNNFDLLDQLHAEKYERLYN